MDVLIKNANQINLSNKNRLSKLAEIHWITTNLMPYKSGSAAIADMTVRTIAKYHNMELPAYKKDIVPDIEALYLTKDQFMSSYSEMFEKPLRQINIGTQSQPYKIVDPVQYKVTEDQSVDTIIIEDDIFINEGFENLSTRG